MDFRLIHAADLHIDSRLRGLEAYAGAPAERLRNATRDALENLVQLAIEQQVSLVLIAGDLFDGEWNDMQTGLWIAQQFRRLAAEDIAVCLIRGNHDAATQVSSSLTWPDNVRELSYRKPETVCFEHLGVALHGQGFQAREVTVDLAADYPPAVADLFNIGLLHTSLAGDPAHDTYAPTSEQTLVDRGYDYWALGHIHLRQIVRTDPVITWSGNTQGRHIREEGPRGCWLVEGSVGQSPALTFCPTDVVRWQRVAVELSEEDSLDDLRELVRDRLIQVRDDNDGRYLAARVTVQGSSRLHRQTVSFDTAHQLVTEVRDVANALDDVWVEKVRFDTREPVDLDQLRRGQDLLGELLRSIDQIRCDNDARQKLINGLIEETAKIRPVLKAAGVDVTDPARWDGWLSAAEQLLVSEISQEENS